MSTFAMKKKLKAEIAAAKKAGKSMQTIGKLQYKLNQISKDSKGTPVRTKDGKTVKSKTGVVRQKAAKKKRGPDMYAEAVALDKPKGKGTGIIKSTAKTTPYKSAKIKKIDVSQASSKKQARGSEVNVNKGGSVVKKRNEEPVLNKGGSVVRKRNKKY